MLVSLSLRNIALIDSLQLTFHEGLTVFTGETGAGKSLFVDALIALFGGSEATQGTKLMRHGTNFAQIEAIFLTSNDLRKWLDEHSFDSTENELILSREWRLNGQRIVSRTRLNGIIINQKHLLDLRALLIDFTVQGHQSFLLSSRNQLSLLDRLGSENLQNILLDVSNEWSSWKKSFDSLETYKLDQENIAKRQNEDRIILQELRNAELLDCKEEIQLKQEENRLIYGVKLQEGVATLFSILNQGCDNLPSLMDQYALCIDELQNMSKLDSSLHELLERSLQLQSNIQDLSGEIERYSLSIESDSKRLNDVQERLALLGRLQRQYSMDLPELLEYKEVLESRFETNDEICLLEELKSKEKELRIIRNKKNLQLSGIRKDLAIELEQKIMKYLYSLGLKYARFKIEFTDTVPCSKGIDSINFLFSANPDAPLAPLSQIASGGEMSRFLLALKTVFSDVESYNTLLFDEIDTGVSGRVSSSIASLLKNIIENTNENPEEIISVLNQEYELPLVLTTKLMNSKIGNIILVRIARIIYPTKISNTMITVPAIRAGLIKSIAENKGKVNLITFLKNYPNKNIAINIPALTKVLKKVESINDLIKFFSNSPLEKLKNGNLKN